MLQKNWVTVKEASKLIGCTVQHVRHLARNDRLESAKLNERAIVIYLPSVEKYCKTEKTVGRPRISEKNCDS